MGMALRKSNPNTKESKPNTKESKPNTLEADELFAQLTANESKCLLKKTLTAEVFNNLKTKKTEFGGTITDCIKTGCLIPCHIGAYASDPDAYNTFEDMLFPIIKMYHNVEEVKHPKPDLGDPDNLPFGDLDPEKEFIVSTRIRVGRSLKKFGFPPVLTKETRKDLEKCSVDALNKLPGDLKGEYFSLETMTDERQKELVELHFLFKDDDECLKIVGGYNDWPSGRGIYHNKDQTFLVWVNEEDHLRIISMQKGGDVGEVYRRLVKAIKSMENDSGLTFATHPKLGNVTFCPTNLGTAMRASVHIRIPKTAALPEFKEICDKYHLQPRGIHGEDTEAEGGVYDISNKRRLGLTEIDAVTIMCEGIKKIIEKEKSL